MSIDTIVTLVSGGGLAAVVTVILNFLDKRTDGKRQKRADAIDAWREIADERAREHADQLNKLEEKTRVYERQLWELMDYVTILQQILLKAVPDAQLPKRPVFGSPTDGG